MGKNVGLFDTKFYIFSNNNIQDGFFTASNLVVPYEKGKTKRKLKDCITTHKERKIKREYEKSAYKLCC
jgi:hypothetical protein